MIDVLDGLVLTGGGDVDPLAYGEEPEPEVAGVDPNRDASERALLAAALAADMPVLAICRGCQVLNVELGGTLHQHLPDVVGHLDAPQRALRLRRRRGRDRAGLHRRRRLRGAPHRALLAPPGHPRPRPRAGRDGARRDGVVEAVELPSARFVLGVQWHPEEGGTSGPSTRWSSAAAAYRGERSVRRSA